LSADIWETVGLCASHRLKLHRYVISSQRILLPILGAWSLELVDTTRRVSFYIKAQSSEVLAHWRQVSGCNRNDNAKMEKAL